MSPFLFRFMPFGKHGTVERSLCKPIIVYRKHEFQAIHFPVRQILSLSLSQQWNTSTKLQITTNGGGVYNISGLTRVLPYSLNMH